MNVFISVHLLVPEHQWTEASGGWTVSVLQQHLQLRQQHVQLADGAAENRHRLVITGTQRPDDNNDHQYCHQHPLSSPLVVPLYEMLVFRQPSPPLRQQQGGESVHRPGGGAARLHQGHGGHRVPLQHPSAAGQNSLSRINVLFQFSYVIFKTSWLTHPALKDQVSDWWRTFSS